MAEAREEVRWHEAQALGGGGAPPKRKVDTTTVT